MGMSTHVVAIKPADDDYKKKLAAYNACVAAGIEIPDTLKEFFDFEEPNPEGTSVTLDRYHPECCATWTSDGREGFQVDITKLPPGTRWVRFYNSW